VRLFLLILLPGGRVRGERRNKNRVSIWQGELNRRCAWGCEGFQKEEVS
jgi:hypothetical protein